MLDDFVYLSKEHGFHARIKAIPEHFIVNELSNFVGDNNRQETISVNSGILKRKASDVDVTNSKRQNTTGTSENKGMKHQYKTKSKSEMIKCDEDWCKVKLCKLLNQNAHLALEEFAQSSLRVEAEKTPGKSQSSSSETPLTLGSFVSRDERTLLHRCVRYVFPHLKTITTPNTPIVSVLICPNYFKFCSLIGHSQAKDLLRFILVENAECYKDDVTITGTLSKEERRQLHHLIASCYGKFMEARTSQAMDDGLSRITVRPKRRCHKKEEVDACGGVLAFSLWKRNAETYTAIQRLASHLSLQPHKLNFAGIKDKRAVTTQCCTVWGISESKLRLLCQSLPKHLRVSDIYPVSRVIHLGELEGNRFNIRLTDVQMLDVNAREQSDTSFKHVVDSAIGATQKTGFVNYFGPQRFGRRLNPSCSSANKNTPLIEGPAIGLALLQGDFEKALKILLNPAEDSSENLINDVEKAKLHFQATGDIEGTLKMMPQHKVREISILKTLKRCGTTDRYAFTKALMSLPHNSRLFYVHSFCSWVWNAMASKRLRSCGPKPVVGDLAISKYEGKENSTEEKVYVVTQDDIMSGRVGPEDIVLTVPGNQVRYPPNLEKEYTEILKLLESPGVEICERKSFRIPELKLNAPGVYRRLLAYPLNMSWRFIPPFKTSTREQQVRNMAVQGSVAEYEDDLSSFSADVRESTQDADDTSLRYDVELAFDLLPSCYATTLLQEVAKGHVN